MLSRTVIYDGVGEAIHHANNGVAVSFDGVVMSSDS